MDDKAVTINETIADDINENTVDNKVDKKKRFSLIYLVPYLLYLIAGYPWFHAMIADRIPFPAFAWRFCLSVFSVWLFFQIIRQCPRRLLIRAAVVVVFFIVWLIGLSDFFMYIIRRTSFNDSFFYHLSWFDIASGFPSYIEAGIAVISYSAITLCLLVLSCIIIVPGPSFSRPRKVVMVVSFVIFAICVFASDNSWSCFTAKVYEIYLSPIFIPDNETVSTTELGKHKINYITPGTKIEVSAIKPKNLVLIFWESMSTVFLDKKVFPGLMPKTEKLLDEAVVFTNMNPSYNCTFSIAGVYSTLMGAPYFYDREADLDRWMKENRPSVSDLLHKVNYYQETMLGHSGRFAKTAFFYRYHSYNTSYAEYNLKAAGYTGEYCGHFGVRDIGLFDFAAKRFEALSRKGQPFNLTIHTMDTHGFHGSFSGKFPVYAKYPSNTMMTAIHEADFLLADFIEKMKKNKVWKDTVVWVVADHFGFTEANKVIPKNYPEKMVCFALNTGSRCKKDLYAENIDLAPTILHSLNVKTNYRFPVGKNLLGQTSPPEDRFYPTRTSECREVLKRYMRAKVIEDKQTEQ